MRSSRRVDSPPYILRESGLIRFRPSPPSGSFQPGPPSSSTLAGSPRLPLPSTDFHHHPPPSTASQRLPPPCAPMSRNRHGMKGMILQIMQQAEDVDHRAQKALQDFCSHTLAISIKQYPDIATFSVPIQKSLAPELHAVEERIELGKSPPEFGENLDCYYQFTRRYLLPCRHIFHLDALSTPLLLIAERWKQYHLLFQESGYEVYATVSKISISNAPNIINSSSRIPTVLALHTPEE